MHFALTSATVHCCCITAHLCEEHTCATSASSNRTKATKLTIQHYKGPGQRQNPVGLSPRHNNPCFKHAQTTDQPKLSKTDTERDRHYHTHRKRKKCLLYAAAFLVLWMLSPTPTVVNDLSRLLLQTAHTQTPCTTSTATYSKVGLRDATRYGCISMIQYDTNFVQIKDPDCWLDCCYLTGATCCSLILMPADIWQADDTRSQAPWDIASSTSTAEPAVQLKRHLIHRQCTTISALQQLAPEAKAHLHANRQASEQSEEAHHTLPAHNKFVNRALPPITRAQVPIHIAYDAYFLLNQVLHCILHHQHGLMHASATFDHFHMAIHINVCDCCEHAHNDVWEQAIK